MSYDRWHATPRDGGLQVSWLTRQQAIEQTTEGHADYDDGLVYVLGEFDASDMKPDEHLLVLASDTGYILHLTLAEAYDFLDALTAVMPERLVKPTSLDDLDRFLGDT